MAGRRAQLAGRETSTGPTAAQRYFASMTGAFAAAERTAGGERRTLRVAGQDIALRFAGGELIPAILPALEHRAGKPGQAPALTVCLWDSASSGTAAPPLSVGAS